MNDIDTNSTYIFQDALPAHSPWSSGNYQGFVRTTTRSNTYRFQECIRNNGTDSEYYIRRYLNGTWTSWTKEPTRSEFDTLNSKTASGFGYISSGSFNDIKRSGLFIVYNLSNAPSASASTYSLIVISSGVLGADGTTVKQIAYAAANENVIYIRHFVSGTWGEWVSQPTRTEVDTLNSKMPWTQIGEVTQAANTSLDELITVENMSNAREIMLTIQRSSNGRTFASSIVPRSQFNSGAIYAFGAYALYTGQLQSGGIIGVNAVCIWQSATQVEVAANSSTEALKYRVWMR